MKKSVRALLFAGVLLVSLYGRGQSNSFPADWIGGWKGELQWYKTGKPVPEKVPMELHIRPTDSISTLR